MQDPNLFIPNLDGRQHSDWLFVAISAAQIAANEGVIEFETPAGGTVVQAFVDVLTPVAGATLDIGDPTDDDRYGAAVAISAAGRNVLELPDVPFYYGKDGTTQKMRLTVEGFAPGATTGEIVVAVQFLTLGKWNFTQG